MAESQARQRVEECLADVGVDEWQARAESTGAERAAYWRLYDAEQRVDRTIASIQGPLDKVGVAQLRTDLEAARSEAARAREEWETARRRKLRAWRLITDAEIDRAEDD